MAWTAPRTWVSGELVTAALLNTHLRDNLLALSTGYLAIASQAAGDVQYASSSTALTRLAADNGKFLKSGSSAPAWADVAYSDVSPLTTRGDVLVSTSGAVTGTRLAVGSANKHLGTDGTDVAWEADPTFATLSPLTTRGDILYSSSGTVTGTRLAKGAANTLLSSDGTDVAWQTKPLTTRGDILVGTSGAPTGARLAKGSANYVLTSDGTDVAWAAAASGGKILQVVYGSIASVKSRTSSTFADTDLTAAITPADDDNKILVLVSHNGTGKVTTNTRLHTKLLRDSTTIAVESTQAYTGTSATNYTGSSSWCVLDSPTTDSEVVYKTQYMSNDDTGTVYVSLNSSTSTMVLLEVQV